MIQVGRSARVLSGWCLLGPGCRRVTAAWGAHGRVLGRDQKWPRDCPTRCASAITSKGQLSKRTGSSCPGGGCRGTSEAVLGTYSEWRVWPTADIRAARGRQQGGHPRRLGPVDLGGDRRRHQRHRPGADAAGSMNDTEPHNTLVWPRARVGLGGCQGTLAGVHLTVTAGTPHLPCLGRFLRLQRGWREVAVRAVEVLLGVDGAGVVV